MNVKLKAACAAYIIPRGISFDGMNGSAVREPRGSGTDGRTGIEVVDDSSFDAGRVDFGKEGLLSLSDKACCPLFHQAVSDKALMHAIHLSRTANKKSPMQVPTIAPALFGTHPSNHSTSPGVKCRYVSICPSASDIAPSIDMSMPFEECAMTGATSTHANCKKLTRNTMTVRGRRGDRYNVASHSEGGTWKVDKATVGRK